MSQKNVILAWLRKGRTITPLEALEIAGSFRLSERIREIEHDGVQIERGWVKAYGGAKIRSYRLAR